MILGVYYSAARHLLAKGREVALGLTSTLFFDCNPVDCFFAKQLPVLPTLNLGFGRPKGAFAVRPAVAKAGASLLTRAS